jgi:cell division protein FtsZ
MESLVQEVFERSFKENNKKEAQESPAEPAQQTSQTEPVQAPTEQPPAQEERPVSSDFSQPEQTTKSIQDEFGINVKEAKIVVIGVGGAGNNCTTRLTELGVKGATTLAINTDVKHLSVSKSDSKLLIGKDLTRGLGAGGYPDVGMRAAEESEKDLKKLLEGTDMIYMVTGLGGGTGTGAGPVIAKVAKEMGCIVIGCTTMPFKIEGARIGKAEDGLYQLRQVCDTVIVIENDRLLKVAGDLPLQQAFAVADNLISTIIKGVTETIATPSLVNLDYADVRTIMHSGGVAAVGFGESDTKSRAEEAVVKAMTNPLLEVNYDGGTGAIVHTTGGPDMKLDEGCEATPSHWTCVSLRHHLQGRPTLDNSSVIRKQLWRSYQGASTALPPDIYSGKYNYHGVLCNED